MPPHITGESVVVASENHVSEDVGDEKIVLDLDSGEYYGLSGIGDRIWELLQSPTTGEEVQAVIREEYDVTAERSREDVMEFLRTLADEGLIDVWDERAPR